jgi:MinD-like ATPase involved in chromosome partitioning or flagellar assembly
MSQIISIHSFRGGTGKSNTTANISAMLASMGKRVAVVDTDIQSPGVHILFGMKEDEIGDSLNNYLWGTCSITDAAYDVTDRVGDNVQGKVFLVPSSIKAGEIARILREGYDVGMLNDGFQDLTEDLELDVLLIDTHPGLNEETLLSIAISDTLIIILRPDFQDYQGTSVTVEVARKLEVPDLKLIVNKVPQVYDIADVKQRVAQTYDAEVAAVLPHSDSMMALASSGIFGLKYPNHEITKTLRQVAEGLA